MRSKLASLRGKKDFSLIWRTGQKIESGSFRLSYRRNSSSRTRVAVVVPRAVDKRATRRNLLRRRAREWVRKNHDQILRDSYDLVLFLKKEARMADRAQLYEELGQVFLKLKEKNK